MRYMRIAAIVIFVAAAAFYIWADHKYNKDKNLDYPVFSCTEAVLELEVADGKEGLLRGLKAHDSTDGDLTDRIMVASTSFFTEGGKTKVKYVVFDAHNNATTFTREVIYKDYHSPRFHLHMPLVYELGSNVDFLSYLQAIDPLEGDISKRIKVVTSQVSNYSAGKFPVALEVTNSYGITEHLQLWVAVVQKNSQTATIYLDDYIAYLEPGESFDPYRHITGVKRKDGTTLNVEDVKVLGGVDPTKPGYYELTYRYEKGSDVAETYLTVVVPEEVAK